VVERWIPAALRKSQFLSLARFFHCVIVKLLVTGAAADHLSLPGCEA